MPLTSVHPSQPEATCQCFGFSLLSGDSLLFQNRPHQQLGVWKTSFLIHEDPKSSAHHSKVYVIIQFLKIVVHINKMLQVLVRLRSPVACSDILNIGS